MINWNSLLEPKPSFDWQSPIGQAFTEFVTWVNSAFPTAQVKIEVINNESFRVVNLDKTGIFEGSRRYIFFYTVSTSMITYYRDDEDFASVSLKTEQDLYSFFRGQLRC